jgi:hypothetical protein
MLLQPLARHPNCYLHRPGGPEQEVPVPCGSGLKFVVFPCVVVVVVVVPPGSGSPAAFPLLPGGFSVVQTTLPWTLLQPGGRSCAPNAERALTDRAATRKAANASIMMMRFIFCVSFIYTHPTPMKLKVHWIGCEFAGAGRFVCASTSSYKQASCPLPVRFLFS